VTQGPKLASSNSEAVRLAPLDYQRTVRSTREIGVRSTGVDNRCALQDTRHAAASGAQPTQLRCADTLAYCCSEADLVSAPSWKNRAATSVPRHLQDEAPQDAIASACDRLARID
jgi:hypothetical protein